MAFEMLEGYIEIVNLVLTVIILILSFKTILKLEGKLKNAGIVLMTTTFLFGIHELVGVLTEFEIFALDESLYFITELLYILSFFIAVIFIKRVFENISKIKQIKQPAKI